VPSFGGAWTASTSFVVSMSQSVVLVAPATLLVYPAPETRGRRRSLTSPALKARLLSTEAIWPVSGLRRRFWPRASSDHAWRSIV
jgi:hypothetical protein